MSLPTRHDTKKERNELISPCCHTLGPRNLVVVLIVLIIVSLILSRVMCVLNTLFYNKLSLNVSLTHYTFCLYLKIILSSLGYTSKSTSCETHGYSYLAGYNPDCQHKGPKLGKVLTVWF